ncbi:hypothetical protein BC941DRAFT_249956 [Chlamydoabsidia padenii]|nr:hypothetical protein BC941DRAFT_249956 [Chlamydoabsidia padenii]
MVELPSHTLLSCLKKALDQSKEYSADICCRFYNDELWIHKGILLSRCSPAFLQHFAPSLITAIDTDNGGDIWMINFDQRLSSSLFKILVTFWYTAALEPLPAHLGKELESLENQLGTQLLPRTSTTDMAAMQRDCYTQLVGDLDRMRQEALGCDIKISLPMETKDTCMMIPAHRFILASQSTYFYGMFCSDFSESQNSVMQLTDHFFTPMVMQVILHYLYSGHVHVPPPPQLDSIYNNGNNLSTPPPLTKIQKLTMKKHSLRTLQMTYIAADYLGQLKTLGHDVLCAMSRTCDGFKCLCHDCVKLLPSMLSFVDKKTDDPLLSTLRADLVTLYSDPANAIEHLWSQKPFAILVHSMVPCAASITSPCDDPISTLISDILEQTYANLTKHNAIHVLHSLHLCFSKLRSADLVPTWSLPILDLLQPILRSTVTMISQHFDFYCVEYPILVSCVDGIGCGFSFDFLDFLLKHVLSQGIQDTNAGIIYQGIVKDLIGRQETVRNVALDDVLLGARVQCTAYLARRWLTVKSSGGFRYLEKATMRQLAIDIGIPYRTLTKPFDSDLLSLFSFKHKSSKYTPRRKSENESPISSTRRRSFGTHRPTNVPDTYSSTTRPRSYSTGATPCNPSSGYVNYNTLNAMSTQPLIHLLSMETEPRRYKQEMEQEAAHRHPPYDLLTDEDLLDALLPMDDIVPVIGRTSRLKFELPSNGPTRAKSPLHPNLYHQLPSDTDLLSPLMKTTNNNNNNNNKKLLSHVKKHGLSSTRKSKWGLGHSSDYSEDDDEVATITPMIGAKVELRRRPLPTFGTIQYVGPVSFAKGTWIGLELESRLGKNNGCVSGVTYFHTDPQRGLFVKQDDFTIISIPAMAH